jgi:hypothetical protein
MKIYIFLILLALSVFVGGNPTGKKEAEKNLKFSLDAAGQEIEVLMNVKVYSQEKSVIPQKNATIFDWGSVKQLYKMKVYGSDSG